MGNPASKKSVQARPSYQLSGEPSSQHENVYPANRPNGIVQPVYKERPQPGTPNAARILEASSPAHGQRTRVAGPPNDMQTPPRGQRVAQGEPLPVQQRVPSAPSEANRGVYKAGQPVELYSKSQQAWCRGTIDKVEGTWVHICYSGPEGQPMNKIMPNGHEEIRAVRVQGDDNADLQRALAPALLSGQSVLMSSAPPPRPQGMSQPDAMQGPGRSPLRPLQSQGAVPEQLARYPGATMPQEAPQVIIEQAGYAPQVHYAQAPQMPYENFAQAAVQYAQAPQLPYAQAPAVQYDSFAQPAAQYAQAPQVAYAQAPAVQYENFAQPAVQYAQAKAPARPLDSTSASLAATQPDLFGHLRGPMPSQAQVPAPSVQSDVFSNLGGGGDFLGGSIRFQSRPPGAMGQQQGQPQLGMPQVGTFGVPQQGTFGAAQPGTFVAAPAPGTFVAAPARSSVAVPQPATPKKSLAGPPGMGSSPSQLSPTVSQPMCQSPTPQIQMPQAHSLAAPCGTAQSPQARPKYQEMDIPNRVPLVAGVERIEPEAVHQMLQSNACVLVDLRGEDRSVGLVPGSIHCQAIDSVPFMQKIPGLLQKFQNQPLVVFTCQYSAHRAPQCANWYREQADARQRVAIMSGGFRGWQGNGLPVEGGDAAGAADKYAADAYALLAGVQFAQKPAAPTLALGQAPLGSYVQAPLGRPSPVGGQTTGYGIAAPMGFSPQRFSQ